MNSKEKIIIDDNEMFINSQTTSQLIDTSTYAGKKELEIIKKKNIIITTVKFPLITPYQAAEKLIKDFPHKLNVISATRDQSVDPSLCKNHLHLPFDDLDTDIETLSPPYKYPQKEDILRAIDFSKKHKIIHIIHCAAGISRSPSIAYAIFRGRDGMSKEEAMKNVMELNPYAIPNKRIVKFTDELLLINL